jgi:hypothetical protein
MTTRIGVPHVGHQATGMRTSNTARGVRGLPTPAGRYPDVRHDRDPGEGGMPGLLHGGCEVMAHGAGAWGSPVRGGRAGRAGRPAADRVPALAS